MSGNAGNAPKGLARATEAGRDVELECFDMLPAEVRAVINASAFKAAPSTILRVMREKGISAPEMVAMLLRQDAKISRQFREDHGLPD